MLIPGLFVMLKKEFEATPNFFFYIYHDILKKKVINYSLSDNNNCSYNDLSDNNNYKEYIKMFE